jgi:hypothetical protein
LVSFRANFECPGSFQWSECGWRGLSYSGSESLPAILPSGFPLSASICLKKERKIHMFFDIRWWLIFCPCSARNFKVSVSESSAACRGFLVRRYADSCVFKASLDMLSPSSRSVLATKTNFNQTIEYLPYAQWEATGACCQHKEKCSDCHFPMLGDIGVYGSIGPLLDLRADARSTQALDV